MAHTANQISRNITEIQTCNIENAAVKSVADYL